MLNNMRWISKKLMKCFSFLKSSDYYQRTTPTLFCFCELHSKDNNFLTDSKVNHLDWEVIQSENY